VTGERVINFDFPLFGQSYPQIYLSSYGTVGMGAHHFSGFQYHFNNQPMIIPLLVDLDENGDFFVSRENDRLVLTWDNITAVSHPEARYTVQTVLFSDGNFKISYNDLPDLKYYMDDRPEATAWAIGIKTQSPAPAADFIHLPMQISPQGAIQDDYRSFRIYLHEFLFPLAVAVVASSFAFLVGAALLLNYGLALPLNVLLEGVQKFDKGQRDTAIPIQSNDEIGALTESFNNLSAELNSLIGGLEQRVAERTQELAVINTQLRSEIEARATAQAQVLEQQRAMAALEERERLARDLHDGIGQVLGFINVQGQSAIDSVQSEDDEAATQLLTRMVDVAQEAHNDVRDYILGLKRESVTRPRRDFLTLLEQYCQHLSQNFGFTATVILPEQTPPILAAKAVETQLLYVIREALSNARAHSGQKQATVTIRYDEQYIKAVVEDRGAGFSNYSNPERKKSRHFGLGIMRERAEELGGSLEIESAPEFGTRVTVSLPRQLKAESTPGRRVLLVDDHPLFLEGMTNLMSGRGLRVVGTASDGLEAQEKARELHPDVILMDIEMPRCDGLEATRKIKAEMPDVKIVMLTVSGEEQHLFEALQSGASGYLLKSLDAAELTALLDELLRGEVSLSPSLAKKMLEAFTRHKAPPAQSPPAAPAGLTERQMEILRLVADGLQYKQVGAQLGLAEVTVKYHMGEILARLHLNSKREAVQYFQENQIK
jgi:DNA-binding NarL/FixJ family response regulator/signal transduction histidine kinase